MSRLIYVPQFPQPMRYQQFWAIEFPRQFKKHFDEVIVLGERFFNQFTNPMESAGMFSSISNSIQFEQNQIIEFMDLKISDDDYLFFSDISFPGFFANILYHKPVKNAFAYCHATSLNRGDYFDKVRYSKHPCETAHSKLFKKVFVGSKYHQIKLGWHNTEVVGLPVPPFETFK